MVSLVDRILGGLFHWWDPHLEAYNCAGFDDASLNWSSWISNSGLRGSRRTYLTILKRTWSANFKMVWYILLRPLRPELDGRPSFGWSNLRKHHQNQHNCRPVYSRIQNRALLSHYVLLWNDAPGHAVNWSEDVVDEYPSWEEEEASWSFAWEWWAAWSDLAQEQGWTTPSSCFSPAHI
jgi:hypothetical protein